MNPFNQELKSSNLVFMLQRKITYPVSQQLKILTELEENIPKIHRPKDDCKLAQITIYNGKGAFEGELNGKCIAKQLTWNAQSMNTVIECLTGKRDKVEIKFYPLSNNIIASEQSIYQFQIVCEISSGINLVLFTIQMKQPKIANSFLHMKLKFSALQNTFRQRQKSYKEKEEKLKAQLNQIQAVQKQIIYSSTTEITLMKKEFIKHINKEKAKIRKLMGSVPMVNPVSGMIQNRDLGICAQKPNPQLARIAQNPAEEQQKIQNTQSMKKNRVVNKVDRQKYERSMPLKMQIDSLSENKYFSAHSNNYDDKQNEERYSEKEDLPNKRIIKGKFADEDSSSDDEPGSGEYQYSGRQNRREKTFLQQHQQQVQKEKKQNLYASRDSGNDWEQLFNT